MQLISMKTENEDYYALLKDCNTATQVRLEVTKKGFMHLSNKSIR
jgi:hypothetical protein